MKNKFFNVSMVIVLAGLVLAACAQSAAMFPNTPPPPEQETESAALETKPPASVEKTIYVGPMLVDFVVSDAP